MEINAKTLVIICVVLLVACLGISLATMNSNSDSGDTGSSDEYAALKEKIKELNEKGGKVYFSTGNNYYEIPAGSNIVSIEGKTVLFKAYGAYDEHVCPISGISLIRIN